MKDIELEKVIDDPEFENLKSPLSFLVGFDESGKMVTADLERATHMVIAGAAGTGKSSFAHSVILSIIKKSRPENVRLILCDTKIVEFSCYNNLQSLLLPVITKEQTVEAALQWAYHETYNRLRMFSKLNCRSIIDYNDRAWEQFSENLPHIVIVIDDVANVISTEKSVEAIDKIIQNGRIVGIHLVLITQFPNNKNLSRIIKTGIQLRAVFDVLTKAEEKTLLDTTRCNADSEIGTMIFYDTTTHSMKKVRCYRVYNDTINIILNRIADLKENEDISGKPKMLEKSIDKVLKQAHEPMSDAVEDSPAEDEMLPAAVDVILETGQASVSMIQRRLTLGYARAARIVDEMEEKGIVGPFQGSKPRAILITKEQWENMHHKAGICNTSNDCVIQKEEDNKKTNADLPREEPAQEIQRGKNDALETACGDVKENLQVKICPRCSTNNPGNANFCAKCAYNFHDNSPRKGVRFGLSKFTKNRKK